MSHPFCQDSGFAPSLYYCGKPLAHEIEITEDLKLPSPPLKFKRRMAPPKSLEMLKLFLVCLAIGSAALGACGQIAFMQVQKEADESTHQVKEALAALAVPYPGPRLNSKRS